MSGESLAQFARQRNVKKMAARRQADGSGGSQIAPTREVRQEETAAKQLWLSLFLNKIRLKSREPILQGRNNLPRL